MGEILKELPAVILRGSVLLPGVVSHFDISARKSIHAVETAMNGDNCIFLVTQKDMQTENATQDDVYAIGVIAEIKQIVKMQNHVVRVIVEAKEKAELAYFIDNDELLKAQVVLSDEGEEKEIVAPEVEEAMLRALQEELLKYCSSNPKIGKELKKQADGLNELHSFIRIVAGNLPISYEKRQKLLETDSVTEQYEALMQILLYETNIMQIKNELQEKVKERVDKNQKEYILREEMKVIREELGEDNTTSDIKQFEETLEKLEADDSVKERIQKEIARFKNVANSPSEGSVVRGYIETLLDLPWNKKSEDNTDLKNAEQILDDDHYGLEKVKERVLEFLAVRGLTKGGESPIICLVGPPGTGKTSIARSVARALNKKYVRICLGGVKDEAEIRGHRRTYVGAMPGRLIQGIRQSGVKNPLMLLDEIDKMSSDYKGDPSSAMLEVLDSEQNSKFIDHYVDMPVDLSEVLFIATANDVHTIPRPLLDRMELIEVSSYTENEKMHIAKEHLLEKQKEKNGLSAEQLTITDEAMHQIISGYTREAGVRNLERKLGEICRKAAREIYEGNCMAVHVEKNHLEDYLGKERFHVDRINDQDEIGIVRGLAWTSVGGDTLQIEVNVMPGKGEFKLTGQLGDVMKESAQAGISYIRSVGEQYDIPEEFFTKHDIHIHIPEGAVPKDGPSAGITMATAMLSAITKKPVRADVAMTGEITLRGRVLPIGGLKEKLLAAKVAGIRTVCVPAQNEADVAEISEEIKEGLQICYVKTMEDVLKIAMNGENNDH
ncbi:endopeptidase La [uncultured Eubacterium sp.]|uniref:endopeptidase La n=1 Tax=uncultured Eubacterium sp. TaxID=165185 RepID=UPI0025D6443C|nr:endopeptidase La [uncultured Eubacterium sp.]